MNLRQAIRRLSPVAALIALPMFGNFYVCAQNQQPAPAPKEEERRIVVQRALEGEGPAPFVFNTATNGDNFVFAPGGVGGTFNFVSSEMSFDMRIVKSAPYTGEAVTETVQTLADGNRIVRRSSALVTRDSEGRTRREQTLNYIGNFAAGNTSTAPRTISINDPVAKVNYILNEKDRTARKMQNFQFDFSGLQTRIDAAKARTSVVQSSGTNGSKEKVVVITENKDGVSTTKEYRGKEAEEYLAKMKDKIKVDVSRSIKDRINTEVFSASHIRAPHRGETTSLGKQIIGGVEAEGTRTTTTIPAGEIGNERPIVITSERWFSPELKVVVMSRRSDPRSGETTYTLTNINRSEPDRSLFEVPSDYTIKESPGNVFRARRPKSEQ